MLLLYNTTRRACDDRKYMKYFQIFEIFQIWKHKLYAIFRYNISFIWRICSISNISRIWTFIVIFRWSIVKIMSENTARCPKYRHNMPKINEIFQIFEIWGIFVKYKQIMPYLRRRKPFDSVKSEYCVCFCLFLPHSL